VQLFEDERMAHVTKIICYIRKSREDEEAERRGEDTLSAQRELMLRDVLSRYAIDYDIKEEVASGDSIINRPVFSSLLPKLGREYQAIAVKDLSRLGRGSYSDMGRLYDIIRDNTLMVITKDRTYDPRNSSDLQQMRFQIFFSREEYEMILQRMMDGKISKSKSGKWVAGSVPYGYQYNRKTQRLDIYEEQAKVVRMMFDWYGSGKFGYAAISTKLHRLGIKSPKGLDYWRPMVIHRMLSREVYIGTVIYGATQRSKATKKQIRKPVSSRVIVQHAHEPMIDRKLWESVQIRLQEAASLSPVKLDFTRCELAGVVSCSGCGHKMVRQSNTRKYKKKDGQISNYGAEYLYCTTCGASVTYRDVEQQLLTVLGRLHQLDDDLLEKEIEALYVPFEPKLKKIDLSVEIEERKSALSKRVERARELLLDGTFTKDEYEQIKTKIHYEIQGLEAELDRSKEDQVLENPVKIDSKKVRQNVNTILETYHVLNRTDARNDLLKAVFTQVKLIDLGKSEGLRRKQFKLEVVLSGQVLG